MPKIPKNLLLVGMTMLLGLATPSESVAQEIDPEANKVLQSMSSYLAKTRAFRVNADISLEAVTQNGQKLQFNSFATVVLQRPNKFHIRRQGLIDATFIFDGQTFTLFGKQNNIYAQKVMPGTIDEAILLFESGTGIPFPGADLLFADPYAILTSGVESSTYLGSAFVNGIECHHLAFRENEVDWQLWVQKGDQPLPIKYVITSKWQVAAPQYEVVLRDWVINPQIADSDFIFVAPAGARRLEEIPANELDELNPIQEKK